MSAEELFERTARRAAVRAHVNLVDVVIDAFEQLDPGDAFTAEQIVDVLKELRTDLLRGGLG